MSGADLHNVLISMYQALSMTWPLGETLDSRGFMQHASLPGIVIICVTPCRSLTTGERAVVGEELILPLSALGERLPLTRISQLPPPWTSTIQADPMYLGARSISSVLSNLLIPNSDYIPNMHNRYQMYTNDTQQQLTEGGTS